MLKMAASSTERDPAQDPERQGHPRKASVSSKAHSRWKVHLFRGMANDLRRRVPYYISDWVDAWDYRVVPATVYMYFAKYVFLTAIWIGFRGKC